MEVDYIFSHRFVFCMVFAAVAGLVKEMDKDGVHSPAKLIKCALVSATSGCLFFFVSYDYSFFTPAKQLSGALLVGYCGSFLFTRLTDKYRMPNPSNDNDYEKCLAQQYKDEPPGFQLDNSVTVDDLIKIKFDISDAEKEELIGLTDDELFSRIDDEQIGCSDEDEQIG